MKRRSAPTKKPKAHVKVPDQKITVFCDGAGCRPADKKGSGFAWVRLDTGGTHIEWVDGLTNNQAEYRAIKSALEAVPAGAVVEILSDAQIVICQLNGEYRVHDPSLWVLKAELMHLAHLKGLRVTFTWLPRGQNRAGKLLESKPRVQMSAVS